MNIVPWNAPATLALAPTVSMLAAGNHARVPLGGGAACEVVVKPAELTPRVSAAVRRLCQRHLSGYVWVEEGGKEAPQPWPRGKRARWSSGSSTRAPTTSPAPEGLGRWAAEEFTGGGEIAKVPGPWSASHTTQVVAARCARTLTPVTLELGGKSPAFVDRGPRASHVEHRHAVGYRLRCCAVSCTRSSRPRRYGPEMRH